MSPATVASTAIFKVEVELFPVGTFVKDADGTVKSVSQDALVALANAC